MPSSVRTGALLTLQGLLWASLAYQLVTQPWVLLAIPLVGLWRYWWEDGWTRGDVLRLGLWVACGPLLLLRQLQGDDGGPASR